MIYSVNAGAKIFISLLVFLHFNSVQASGGIFWDVARSEIVQRSSPACRASVRAIAKVSDLISSVIKPGADIFSWYSGGQLKQIPSKAIEIFIARYRDPTFSLSIEQKAYLTSLGLLQAYEYFDGSPKYGIPFFIPSQFWSVFRAMAYRSKPISSQRGILNRIPILVFQGMEVAALVFFPPALILRLVFSGPRTMIGEFLYKKVREDPEYQLGRWERMALNGLSFSQDLERYRSDATHFRESFRRHSIWRSTMRLALAAAVATAIFAVSSPSNTIFADENNDEKSPFGMSRYDQKVELIFFHPMPHASLRIGGVVYNFSTGFVDKIPLKRFLKKVGFSPSLSGSQTRVELLLTESERLNLILNLNQRVGEGYLLIPPFNDCISQTNLAIHDVCSDYRILPGANRSQALTISQLKIMKLMGVGRVGQITYVDRTDISNQKYWTLAATWAELATFARYTGFVIVGGEVFDSWGAPSWETPNRSGSTMHK